MKKAASILRALVVSLPAKALATAGRLSIVALLFSLFTLTFVSPVHAQCQPTPNELNYQQVVTDVYKCAGQEKTADQSLFTYSQIVNLADSINVLLTGYSLNHPETNAVTENSSAIAGISRGIALTYAAPPVSGVDYVADQIQKLNPIQPAYAQGVGFTALQPVQRVWGVFRDASYVAFIIIFVIMGFMIMFRAHISPQAVATVQDSIPRIVVAIILVTFSYAIAGLMVDLMYVVINLAISLLTRAGLNPVEAQNVFKQNIFSFLLGGWPEMVSTTSGVIKNTLQTLFRELLGASGCSLNLSLTDAFGVGDCAGKAIAWMLGWIGGIILGIALLLMTIKIFFMLLIAYVTIILLTIFAPFFFLIQALPGNNGAKEWFKQMVSNIAVFPTVIIMFLLAGLLGGVAHFGGVGDGVFNQGFNDAFRPPLLTGGFDAQTLGKLIAIGIVFIIPQAAELVKNTLGVKGGPNLGAGIAGGLAAGAAPVAKFGGMGAKAALEDRNIPFVGGAWKRQREAKRQDEAQIKAGAGVYNPEYAKALGRVPEEKTKTEK